MTGISEPMEVREEPQLPEGFDTIDGLPSLEETELLLDAEMLPSEDEASVGETTPQAPA